MAEMSSSSGDYSGRDEGSGAGGGGSGFSPSDATGSGGSVQGHYEDLVSELATATSDLKKTISAANRLSIENQRLRDNYHELKEELVRVAEQAERARSECFAEAQARLDVERQHEAMCRQWREQLEQKEQEMEQLHETLAPPRDLELLRIKIQEELEVPHAQKVADLETQLEASQNECFHLRREYELLRTEFAQFTEDQGNEAMSNAESHKAIVAELHKQISALQAEVDSAETADLERQLLRLKAQAEMREKELLGENDQLRAENSALKSSTRETIDRLKEELAGIRTYNMALTAEKANAVSRMDRLASDVDRLSKELRDRDEVERTERLIKDSGGRVHDAGPAFRRAPLSEMSPSKSRGFSPSRGAGSAATEEELHRTRKALRKLQAEFDKNQTRLVKVYSHWMKLKAERASLKRERDSYRDERNALMRKLTGSGASRASGSSRPSSAVPARRRSEPREGSSGRGKGVGDSGRRLPSGRSDSGGAGMGMGLGLDMGLESASAFSGTGGRIGSVSGAGQKLARGST